MPRQIGDEFERHIAHRNEHQELEIRNQAEQRRREAEAAARGVRNNLHDEEPTASQLRRDTIPEVPPRPRRRAPQPQPPATPPASLLDGRSDSGEGDSQETIRNLREQLRDKTREHEESLSEIERLKNKINETEEELQGIHELQVAAIDQARLAEANRFRERYDRLREVLTRTEEEKREAVRKRDESERESEDLRRQLRRAEEELQEQRLRETIPRSEVVDDTRTIGGSSIGQTRSSQDKRSERGSQRRSSRYAVRSTWSSESVDRPRRDLVRFRPIKAREAYIMGA
jgi:hypothetical protein